MCSVWPQNNPVFPCSYSYHWMVTILLPFMILDIGDSISMVNAIMIMVNSYFTWFLISTCRRGESSWKELSSQRVRGLKTVEGSNQPSSQPATAKSLFSNFSASEISTMINMAQILFWLLSSKLQSHQKIHHQFYLIFPSLLCVLYNVRHCVF